MNRIVRLVYVALAAFLVVVLSAQSSTSAAQSKGMKKMFVSARVLSVAGDKKTVTINKGTSDNAKAGMAVTIKFNRGTSNAEVEWDIVLARGTISTLDVSSANVKLTLANDTVQAGDYCELEVEIPELIEQEDIGRIALYDIVFLDYEYGYPFFELRDLIADPTQKKIDNIYADLEDEIGYYADSDTEDMNNPEKIKGGIFNGMDRRTALLSTKREHLEKFIEYVAWYAGNYINFDWYFYNTYLSWVTSGTDSGEPEKRKDQAMPYATTGDTYTDQEKYQEALDSYKEAIRINPDYTYAKDQIASITNVLKYRKMLEEDAKDAVTLFDLSDEYYNLGLYNRALETLFKARDLGYEDPNLTKLIGYSYRQLNRFKEAVGIFEELVSRFPDNKNYKKWLAFVKTWANQADKGETAQSNVALGKLYYEEDNNYDQAAKSYNKALELAPGSKDIWNLILRTAKRKKASQYEKWAKEYWDKGYFEDAKSYWQTAIDACKEIKDTQSVIKILDDMAGSLNDSEYYDDAIKVYLQILDLDKKHYESYMNIANCYTDKKEYDKAATWAEKGMPYNPTDAWGNNILGNVKSKLGKYDESIPLFKKSIAMDKTYKYPLYNLAFAYAMKENYEEAAKQCSLALDVDTDYSDARNRLVSILCVLETKAILKTDTKNVAAQVRLGMALFNLYDYPRAIAALKQALILDKNEAKANTYIGYSYIRQDKYEEGKKYLEDSIRLNPRADVRSWLLYTEANLMLSKNPNDPLGYIKLGQDSMYWENFDSALTSFETASKLGADKDAIFNYKERARKGLEAGKEYAVSNDFYSNSDFEKAMEHAKASLELYKKSGARKGEYWSLIRIGWCYAFMYKHEPALEYYNKAKEIADELNEESLITWYISSMGDYYKAKGDYEKALEYKKQTRDLYHANNNLIEEARTGISAVGDLVGLLGEFDAMLANYEKALSIHRDTANPKAEAGILSNIGDVYVSDGDYQKALDYYNRSLAISQKYDDKWYEMTAYGSLGNVYSFIGDGVSSLKNDQRYLESALALGSKSNRAAALNKIGLTYLENLKDNDKARSYFEECLHLAVLIDYRLMQAAATANIGVCLSRNGKPGEALKYHDESLAIVIPLKDRYMEMQGLHEKGESLFLLKRYDEALDCQIRSLKLAEALGDKTEQWTYLFSIGKAYEEKGDATHAIEYYKKTTEVLSGIKNKIKSEKLMKDFSAQDSQVDVYKRLIALLVKAGKTEEALRYIDESRSKLIKDAFGDVKPETQDPHLKETLGNVDRYERKKEAIEKQVQEEMKKPKDEQDATKLDVLAKTLASTEGEFNQWMLKLKFQNAAMYDALTIKPSTLGDIQKDIPRSALILEYFYSETDLYIFCIANDAFLARSAAIKQDDLVKLVGDYISLCQNPRSLKKKDMPALGEKLDALLIETVADVVAKYDTLIVIPFGILHYLPFQALPHTAAGKTEYLMERKRVCYTTSSTFADVLKGVKKDMSSIMGIGNPDGSLPGAQVEVNSIKDKIYKTAAKVLVSQDATKKNFFKLAKNYTIIHLATHGIILNNPLESYLLLSGKTAEDRQLTLLEIAGYTELREKNTLVFLSACETAVELVRRNGAELISLAEAFAMAGTPTLIASLWEVDDASTQKLAVAFYEELKAGKRDKLDSLRDAQIGLLKSKEYSHPFYWAPFILIGSWQ